MSSWRSALVLLVGLLSACVHPPDRTGMTGLKKAVQTFEERVRWKDFRGAMELLVPPLRRPFDDARTSQHDDEDLSLTEMETLDAQLSDDGQKATVLARWSWMRLPSTKVETARVTSSWEFHDGLWLLARQDGGPFENELAPAVPRK